MIERLNKLTVLVIVALVLGINGNLFAQTDPIIKGSDIRPLTTSGGIGITASTYSANGIDNRRAPASLKTNANVNFSILGFKSGINLLYSTDQSKLRQNMNAISFDANYKWISLQAGTVSPSFSEYGLSGTSIQGGYIKLDPGTFLLEFAGGRTQKAINFSNEQGFREPAFERYSYGGKLGVGRENNSHFHISTHYSKDDVNSIDSLGTITPKQNLTITPDAKISLFQNKFSLSGNVTVSAFTRDLNSDEVDTDEAGIPKFITNLFPPHLSSRVNYAGKAGADLNLQNFGLNLGYERIQPGFVSLGVGRIRDDQQTISIGTNTNFLDNRITLGANISLGKDNLLGNRIQTTSNTAFGTNITFQISEMVSLNTSYNMMLNDFESNTQVDSLNLGQQQVSHTLMLQPNFMIQTDNGYTHNISISGSYFNMLNEFQGAAATQDDFSSDTYSSSLAYNISFPAGFSINAIGNYLVLNSNNANNVTLGANLGTSYGFLQQKLNVSINAGFNQNKNEVDRSAQNMDVYIMQTQQLTFNMSANYRIYKKGSLSASLRQLNNNIIHGAGAKYSEIEANLVFRHRF